MAELDTLYKRCLFRSHEQMETHNLVAEELADHHLKWAPGRVDTRLYKFDTPRLSLYSLRYGAEVSIYPDLYDQFSLVHFSLNGQIEITADRQTRILPQGQVAISSPRNNINLHWSKDSEQLILRLPHALLWETAEKMNRPDLFAAALADPGLVLPDSACRQWHTLLKAFVTLQDGCVGNGNLLPWLAHMEESLVTFILLQATSGDRGKTAQPEPLPHHVQHRLDRLTDFAKANLETPLTLSDLARACALSERQLNTFCHRHMGQSPMAWLRGLRLDAIRQTLRTRPDAKLTDLAMLHGFFHLGRFSSSYRKRFGELPSQTQRSAKSG